MKPFQILAVAFAFAQASSAFAESNFCKMFRTQKQNVICNSLMVNAASYESQFSIRDFLTQDGYFIEPALGDTASRDLIIRGAMQALRAHGYSEPANPSLTVVNSIVGKTIPQATRILSSEL